MQSTVVHDGDVKSLPTPLVIPNLIPMKLIVRHYIAVSERTIYSWISAGTFPHPDVSIGGKVRLWRKETIETWIESNLR